jgi:hypothetical protein
MMYNPLHETGRVAPGVKVVLLGVAAWLLLIATAPAGAQTLERTPYLMAGTPDSIVVRWRTTSPPTNSVVRYGSAPGSLTQTVTIAGSRTEHEVAISGLTPNTQYFYSVGFDATTLAGADVNHFFVTPPLQGTRQATRIWVIGDSGECAVSGQGCLDANAVKNEYLAWAGSDIADLWLILGDNAYTNGTDQQYTDGFFDVYPDVMRNTILYPTLGNHELGSGGSNSGSQSGPYYDSFSMPSGGGLGGGVVSGTEAYYSFDWANIHFISIDSATQGANLAVGGLMYNWLETDLIANTQEWTIVYWHHPPYTKGSHDSDDPAEKSLFEMRERFVPLIESHGVDLQLTGHSHSYERSVLINGHTGLSSTCALGECFIDGGDGKPSGSGAYIKATLGPGPDEGTVYSVVGSSSKNAGGLTQHPVMTSWINFEGSMVIDVDGSSLDAFFIDRNGVVDDHFRILKNVGFIPPGVPSLRIPGLTALSVMLVVAGLLARSRFTSTS